MDIMTLNPIAKQTAPVLNQEVEVEDGLHDRLTLARQLHASLVRSQQAVAALDLIAIDDGTREQICLSRELETEIQRGAWGAEGTAELIRSEEAVMQALRLQTALLRRAQHKLQVLTNTLAGPAMNYAPLIERSAQVKLTSAWKLEERI